MANSMLIDERRRFHRILFDAPISLRNAGRSHQTRLLDLSLKGALVEMPRTWTTAMDGETTLHIALGSGEICIEMVGQVVHQESGHLGFFCVHIDMDSITHLRRLVELNLGDPDLLERDIAALG